MNIPPTPGRVVWFYPGAPTPQKDGSKPAQRFVLHRDPKLPLAALLCGIHDDEKKMNLAVFDAMGLHHPVQDVPLLQPGELPPAGPYCTWMPYQVGQARSQAAKAAEVQRPADPLSGVFSTNAQEPEIVANPEATATTARMEPASIDIPSAKNGAAA